MSTKTGIIEQVAAQIAHQWPYSRLNVTIGGGGGSYVTVGPCSAQFAVDYWHVPREGQPDRRYGYESVDPVVISDTLMEAVAHNGRASVKDRVTAFDARCTVHQAAGVTVVWLPGGEDAVIATSGGSVTLVYGEETHCVPTVGHALTAIGAILSQA